MVPPHFDLKFLLKFVVHLGLDDLATEIEKMTKPSLGDWIKLDVGGTIFKTSRQTLTQVPDSLLGRMFDPDSSLPPAKMEDGVFLIDASPSSFPVILHWLRCREVSLGEVTVETALSAANYFGLQPLVLTLQEIIKKKEEPEPGSDWIKLSAEGTIFESSRATLIRGHPFGPEGRPMYRSSDTKSGLLAKMFDPSRLDYCPPPRNSNGVYLIDCNPQIFSVVLDMQRYGDCSGITKENFRVFSSACHRYTGVPLNCGDLFKPKKDYFHVM